MQNNFFILKLQLDAHLISIYCNFTFNQRIRLNLRSQSQKLMLDFIFYNNIENMKSIFNIRFCFFPFHKYDHIVT